MESNRCSYKVLGNNFNAKILDSYLYCFNAMVLLMWCYHAFPTHDVKNSIVHDFLIVLHYRNLHCINTEFKVFQSIIWIGLLFAFQTLHSLLLAYHILINFWSISHCFVKQALLLFIAKNKCIFFSFSIYPLNGQHLIDAYDLNLNRYSNVYCFSLGEL